MRLVKALSMPGYIAYLRSPLRNTAKASAAM